ncbi:hypothetical protein DFH94DRAFT_640019, partial [Russula ochroleuca]
INLADATPDELEKLTRACEPASFGRKQETVKDENYRKAVKMDSEYFSPILNVFHTDLVNIIYDCLLEGTQSTKRIKIELYKLNVYDKGSFFKPHVDTPRSKNMFGSLVIVFPTPHEGGALLLRHRGQEWIFDSGKELAAKDEPSIGYAAFFSDIEHEVAPVITRAIQRRRRSCASFPRSMSPPASSCSSAESAQTTCAFGCRRPHEDEAMVLDEGHRRPCCARIRSHVVPCVRVGWDGSWVSHVRIAAAGGFFFPSVHALVTDKTGMSIYEGVQN